ncbi:hypothetical protein JXA88_03655 [Candidatus Fermentibacteria bacterium]|nr:hypothetical protein [Candidatus Fermentibacteria bacterium]
MRVYVLLFTAAVLVASGHAVPPAPQWGVTERVDGLDISLAAAPWISFPLDGDEAVVRATGAALTRETGWPELPVYYLLFAVPPGCEPRHVATAGIAQEHALRAVPVGVWSTTAEGLRVDRTSRVPSHMSGALYPSVWAGIEPWGTFRGVTLYALKITPLQQRLGGSQLLENLGMRVEITWDSTVDRGGVPVEARYLPVLQSMVINPETATWVGTTLPTLRPAAWAPPYPAVKITVPSGRPVAISREALAAVAPDLAAAPADELSLTWKGEELPCVIETSGGALTRIAFVSPALPPEYADEAFENVMWLGRGGGLQAMRQRDATPGAGPEVTSHPVSLVVAEELDHSDYTPTGDALQWWWAKVETQSPGQISVANLSFSVSTVDKSRPINLTLAGSADAWTTHRLRVSMGGRVLVDTTWTNRGPFTVSAPVQEDMVYVGTNVVKVEGIGQSTAADKIWLKSLTLDFHTGTAAMDSLLFAGEAGDQALRRYRLEGFRYPEVMLLDVSDPADPVRLTGHTVDPSSGGYAVAFGDSVAGDSPRRYMAFAPDRGVSRPAMELRTAGALAGATGADYLAITHPLFQSAAARLAAHRETRGLSTLVVDVNEVFDRFGYGYPSSLAIDEFIAWAYGAFDPRPGFVVLIGDGSARQRHGNQVSPNLIPVRLISRVADENAYADVDNDSRRLPDVALGRLSVQTAAQANDFVDKIIAAETLNAPSHAHARIAFFADDASGTASQPGFAVDCETIIASVSPAYFPERIYLSYNGGSNDAWNDRPTMLHSRAKGEAYYRPWILDTIRDGMLLLTYVGHGGINTWATEWIITTDDAPEMLTAPDYPLITSFSCDTGRFDDPDYDIVMAEHFTRWREGALAFFSSSRESYPSDNGILSVNLHRALLDRGLRQIGLAIQVAKIQTDLSYVCRAYSLLGDPASELPVPSAGDLAASVVPDVVTHGTAVSGTLTWEAVSSAELRMDLVDAFGILLASRSQTVTLPFTSELTIAEVPPPGTGALRVWARSGAAEALTLAQFTSPANVDTALVTPETGSGGFVASNNGNILVTVPPWCVDDTTVVRIAVGPVTRVADQRRIDVCPVPGAGSGRAYTVGFDSGENGRIPLPLRLAYDTNWVLPADVDSLMAAVWDAGLGRWVGLPGSVVGGRVEAEAPAAGQFTVLVVYDRDPPVMPSIEIQRDNAWQLFQEGEFVQGGEWMRASLTDHDGILGSSIRITLAGQAVAPTYESPPGSPQEGSVLFELPLMQAGSHALVVRVADIYGNEAAHRVTVRAGGGLSVAGFAAIPSPFTDHTTLRFVLSDDAAVAEARVYTVSGRLIRTIELANPFRGTNLMPWDGLDADGDRIAGGVYLMRLSVQGGGLAARAETKVVRRP